MSFWTRVFLGVHVRVGVGRGVGLLWCRFVKGCRLELGRRRLSRSWVPATLPTPRTLLAGLEVLSLTVCDPFRTAFEVSAEEVTNAVCVFETWDVNGQS